MTVSYLPVVISTMADLKALPRRPKLVTLLGFNTENDGGGGNFVWVSGSSTPDNGGTVIAPTSGGGRYIRQYNGPVKLRWFGCVGNNITDDQPGFVKALASGLPWDGERLTYLLGTGRVTLPEGTVGSNAYFTDGNWSTGHTTMQQGSLSANSVGSAVGTTMTITSMTSGQFAVGQLVDGSGIQPPTYITAILTGTGGVGTYQLSRDIPIFEGSDPTTVNTVIRGYVLKKGPNLNNIRINRNGLGSAGEVSAINLSLLGCKDFQLVDVEIYGNGIGKAIQVEACTNFKMIRPYIHDIQWSLPVQPGSGGEQITGIFIAKSSDFIVTDRVVMNLTGLVNGVVQTGPVDAYQNTDGTDMAGCTNGTFINGFTQNVGEGVDISGQPSLNAWVYGDIYRDCAGYGLKFSSSQVNIGSIGCRAYNCGLAGFVLAGNLTTITNVTHIDAQAYDTGKSGYWAGAGYPIAGFAVQGGANPMRQISFIDCVAISEYQNSGFSCDGAPSAELRIVNPRVEGWLISDYSSVSRGKIEWDSSNRLSIDGGFDSETANLIGWDGRTHMFASSDGDLLLQNAGATDFGSIKLGGTTSAFPMITRDGANARIRLADNSGESGYLCDSIRVGTGGNYQFVNRSKITSPADGTIRITNSAGSGFTSLTFGNLVLGLYTCTGSPEGAITAAIGSLAMRTDGGVGTTLYVKQSGAGNTGWVAK